jgi:hypothetical protein
LFLHVRELAWGAQHRLYDYDGRDGAKEEWLDEAKEILAGPQMELRFKEITLSAPAAEQCHVAAYIRVTACWEEAAVEGGWQPPLEDGHESIGGGESPVFVFSVATNVQW